MQKQLGQLSFADGLVVGAINFLSEVDEVLDFGLLEKELSGIYDSSTGRPSYPLLLLFKTLLLQQWYNLSDPGMEEALTDRISFRRFVGLSLSDVVPDHSTISRFRFHLGDRYEVLLSSLNAQFESQGFIIKQGTMLDASFVRSSSPKRTVDPEAGVYGSRKKDNVCGYKMHMAVDKKSGLTRRVIITPANINDTTPADDLIMGDEKAVYADKAYDKHSRRKALEESGIFAGLMHRPNQYHPLTPKQTAFNKRMTKLRAPVEHVFGILKNHYRLRRTRYIGLTRTAVQITLACMAMNIKRCLVLART
jgi:IS5 family transposase